MSFYEYIPYRQSNEDKCKVKYSHQRIKQILLYDYHIALDHIWAGYKGNRYRGYVERYNMRNIDTNEIIAENVTLNSIRLQLQDEGYSLHDSVKPNKGAIAFLEYVESIKGENKVAVKDTTFARTMSDYKRFFPECSFAQKSITAIKPIDIKEYLQHTILQEKLKKRAYSNLKALLNGIFRYALDKEYIQKNPMTDIMISTANIQQPTRKTKEEEVFTNKEKDLLRDYIKADKNNYKNSVPYAILLSFQLGLRVSELVALKWSDIDSNKKYIHIQRQETICNKYNDDLVQVANSVHEIKEYTKTQASNRLLPLTQEALRILKDIETWNISTGIKNEYIFSDTDGRTFNRQRINTCLYSYCNKVNIIKKSSHKVRHSVISSLLDNIANKKAVQSFAGHEELETTLNSYYKDITEDNDLLLGMSACL